MPITDKLRRQLNWTIKFGLDKWHHVQTKLHYGELTAG